MGKPVNERATDGGKPGFMEFGGNDPDKGNRRPADDVAEKDGGNTGDDPQRRLFLKRGKIRLLIHGLTDKILLCKVEDESTNHWFTRWL